MKKAKEQPGKGNTVGNIHQKKRLKEKKSTGAQAKNERIKAP